jgi:hypothetical protein
MQLPDKDEIKIAHRHLYTGHNQSSVAASAGFSNATLSRHLNVNEPVEDHLYEVMAEMSGTVISKQPEVGKGLFKMLYNHAVALGLVDEEPVDIIKLANDRLRRITKEEIAGMSGDERTLLTVYAADLENEAGRVKTDALREKRKQEGIPRLIELKGSRATK